MLNKISRKIFNIYKPKLTKKRKVYCSPDNTKNKYTCFSLDSLKKIAKKWNKNNKDKIRMSKSIPTLWKNIRKKMNNNNEWCWIQQNFIKELNDDKINSTFRPQIPNEWYLNKNEWLSTIDIEDVMKQYEDKHKDFQFVGPVPIDFDLKDSVGDCIIDELCKIDIFNLKKQKIVKIGIIFNLDKHDQNGSHWVALYSDLNKNNIYYFDSYGLGPPQEIDTLAQRLVSQGNKNNTKINYKKNNNRFQFKGSECGVYCMYFITELLKGKSFTKIKNNIIKDDEMMENRGYFYSPNCSI